MTINWRNDGSGLGTDEQGRLIHDCVHREPIKGAKAGEAKTRTPNVAKDTASSTSTAKILYGLAEGEIFGLIDGGKSIYLDGTPLLDDNGNKNFENVTWDFRAGTNEQEYIKGFPDVSNEIGIGLELKSSQPWIRAFTNTQLSALRLRLKWNRLSKTDATNGDVTGYEINYAIDLQTNGGAYVEYLNTKIADKLSAGYERTHRIDLPKSSTGWQIRVRRLTANNPSDLVQDTMFIDAVAEVIDVKLAYPNTALLGIQYPAETFGSIAKMEAHIRGSIIRVPSNYDPVERTYLGIWDGTFKDAYSNNPVWIYYDICTQWRYGLGGRLDAGMIDKWSLYAIGQYCDQKVSDGQGGLEPRFSCNVYLQKQADAYQVLQNLAGIFRALSFWNGEQIVLDADVPKDPIYTFSRANVVDGNFDYPSTRQRDRHTLVKVAWDNPINKFETEYEYIRDDKAIAKFGVKVLDLSAFGCTSQAQAQRAGLWALKTELLETRQVLFSSGLDGINLSVGSIINVSDELFAGRANGGRISSVSAAQYVVTIDRDITVNVGDNLVLNNKLGKLESRKIKSVNGRKLTVAVAFEHAERENVWAVESEDLKLMRFRVISISQETETTYNIIGIQNEPQKYDAIDFGTDVKPTPITVTNPNVIDAPQSVTVSSAYKVYQGQNVATLVISWSQVEGAVAYDVEWRKDNGSWVKVPRISSVSVDIDGIYSGSYLARVRAISAFDSESKPTTSNLTVLKGKAGSPQPIVGLKAVGVLFGMKLSWGFAPNSKDTAYTEIEVGSAPLVNVAVLGQYSYSTNSVDITGLQGGLSRSYRGRTVDKLGNTSAWSAWVTATTDNSTDKIMDLIQGQIDESTLDQALREEIGKIDTNKALVDAAMAEADALIAANKVEVDASLAAANSTISQNKAAADAVMAQTGLAIATANANIKANKDKLVLTDAEVAAAKTKATALEQSFNSNKASVTNELLVLSNKDKSLASDITAINATVAGNTASIDTNNTAMVTKTTALSNSINSINAEYATNKANVTRDLTALATKDTAIVSDINSLVTKTNNTNTEISTIKTAVADNKTSIAKVRTDLTAKFDANEASIESEATARASADETLTNSITTLKSAYEGNKATVTNSLTTLTNKDIALTNSLATLDSDYKGNKSSVATSLTTLTNKDVALTNSLNSLTSTVGGHTSSINTLNSTVATNTQSIAQTRTDLKAEFTVNENLFSIVDCSQGYESLGEIKTSTPPHQTMNTLMPISGDKVMTFQVWNPNKVTVNASNRVAFFTADKTYISSATVATLDGSAYKTNTVTPPTGARWVRIGFIVGADGIDTSVKFKAEEGTATAWSAAGADGTAAKAAIINEATVRAEETQTLLSISTFAHTEFNSNKTEVSNKLTALTNKDVALTNSITGLTSTVGGHTSSINTLNSTVATNTQSIAQAKTELKAEFTAFNSVQDTRNDNENPKWYWDNYPAQTAKEFKGSTKVGITSAGNYVYVETLVKWRDASGGAIVQMAYDNSGDVYSRKSLSDTAWSAWIKQEDVTGSEAKVAALKSYIEPKVTANTSSINTEKTTRANADSALGSRIDTVSAQAGTNKAAIQTETNARVTAVGSVAESVTTLQTRAERSALLSADLRSFPSGWLSRTASDASAYYSTANFCAINTSPNLGKDSGYNGEGWYVYDESFKVNRHLVYKVSAETLIARGEGSIYIGLAGVTANGSLINAVGNLNDINRFWYAGSYSRSSSGGTSWRKWEAYYSFDQSALDAIETDSPKILLSDSENTSEKRIESVKLMWISNYANSYGYNQLKYFTIEALEGANEAKIQQTFKTVDGLSAQYTLKLDVGGRVSGFGLASSSTQSEFAVNADRFWIAPPLGSSKGKSPFMVLTSSQVINGVTVPAGTYMEAAFIHNGSIDIAKINKATITSLSALSADIGTLTTTDSRGTFTYQGSKIVLRDNTGRLLIEMGLL